MRRCQQAIAAACLLALVSGCAQGLDRFDHGPFEAITGINFHMGARRTPVEPHRPAHRRLKG